MTNLSKDKDTVVVELQDGEQKEGKDKAAKDELDLHLDIDYESLNISKPRSPDSATYRVFRDLDLNISSLEKEFETLEKNLDEQKKYVISKIKSIIRYELMNSSKI